MKRIISLFALLSLPVIAFAQKYVKQGFAFTEEDTTTEYALVPTMVVDTAEVIRLVKVCNESKRKETVRLFSEYSRVLSSLQLIINAGENGHLNSRDNMALYEELMCDLSNNSERGQLFLDSPYVTERGADKTTWLDRYNKGKKKAEKLWEKKKQISPVIYEYAKWLFDYYDSNLKILEQSIEVLDSYSYRKDYFQLYPIVTGETKFPQKLVNKRLDNPYFIDPLLRKYMQESSFQEADSIKKEETQAPNSAGQAPRVFNASNYSHAPLTSLQDPFNINRHFRVLKEGPGVEKEESFTLHGWRYECRENYKKPMYRNGESIYINGLRSGNVYVKQEYPGIVIKHTGKEVMCNKSVLLRSQTEYLIADYIITKEQLDMFMSQFSDYTVSGTSSTVASSYKNSIGAFRKFLEDEGTFYTEIDPKFRHVLHLIPKNSSDTEFLIYGETISGNYQYLMMDWWNKCCAPLIGTKLAIEGSYDPYRDDTIEHSYKDYVSKQIILLKNSTDFNYTIRDLYYDYQSTKGDLIFIIEDKEGNTFTIHNRVTGFSSYSFLDRVFSAHSNYWNMRASSMCFYGGEAAPLMIPKREFDTLITHLKGEDAKRNRSEAQRKAAEQQEKNKRKAELARKYGEKNAGLIADGFVQIGMTQEMCIAAWGTPLYKREVTTRLGKAVRWYYGPKTYLQFFNGSLEIISN